MGVLNLNYYKVTNKSPRSSDCTHDLPYNSLFKRTVYGRQGRETVGKDGGLGQGGVYKPWPAREPNTRDPNEFRGGICLRYQAHFIPYDYRRCVAWHCLAAIRTSAM